MSEYDVVVIGAGCGGLSSAVTLAQRGIKVLLLEKHNIPGGCATSFCRGRFEFEVSLHQLSGMGTKEQPGPLRNVLQPMGVLERIEPVREDYLYAVKVEEQLDLKIPTDRNKLVDKLHKEFPEKTGEISRFVDFLYEFCEQAIAVTLGWDPDPTVEKYPLFFSYMLRDTQSVFDEFLDDHRLQMCLMAPYLGYFGLPSDKLPFFQLARPLWGYMVFGPSYIIGGSQALSNALIDCFVEAGGTVKFNCGVEAIQLDEGKVKGVVTEDGQTYPSSFVISNASPIDTYLKLIGRDQVPQQVIDDLNHKEVAVSAVTVYMGLDCEPGEVGITSSLTNMSDKTAGPNACFTNPAEDPKNVGLTCYNLIDSNASPQGTSVLSLISLQYGASWQSIPAQEYGRVKHEYASKMIELAEKFYPGIRDHIEEVEVATPLTHMNYLSTPGGSIYGFSPYAKDLGVFNSLSSPIEGLFFAGAWVSGGGYQPALMSGVDAANELLEQFDAQEEAWSQPENTLAKLIQSLAQVKEDDTPATPAETDVTYQRAQDEEFLNRIHPKKVSLKVSQIVDETESVRTVRLIDKDGGVLPFFEPGQYINITVQVNGTVTSRPYSISSAPREQLYYDVTVKRTSGGFVSNYLLDELRVGDRLDSSAPAGEFFHQPIFHGTDLVMLAGGSGITPMMSMIRQFIREDSDKQIHLVYISRTPEELIFNSELESIQAKSKNFTYTTVISRPTENYQGLTGHITADLLSGLLQNITDKTYYLCGPAGMCEGAKQDLLLLGVRPGKIRQENFGNTEDVTTRPDWPETANKTGSIQINVASGVSFNAPVGESLLNSLDRGGVQVPSRCHSGQCSLCRVKLISGEVYKLPDSKERVSDGKYGYINSCSAYPTCDVKIEA